MQCMADHGVPKQEYDSIIDALIDAQTGEIGVSLGRRELALVAPIVWLWWKSGYKAGHCGAWKRKACKQCGHYDA